MGRVSRPSAVNGIFTGIGVGRRWKKEAKMSQKLGALFRHPLVVLIAGGIVMFVIHQIPGCMKDSRETKIKHDESHKNISDNLTNLEDSISSLGSRLDRGLEKLDSTLNEVSHSVERLKGFVARDVVLSSAVDGFVPIPATEVDFISGWFSDQDVQVTVFTDEMINELRKLNKELLVEAVKQDGMEASYAIIDFSEIEAARSFAVKHPPKIPSLSNGAFGKDVRTFPFAENDVVRITKLSAELANTLEASGDLEISRYRVIGPEQFEEFAISKASPNLVLKDAVMSGGNVWLTAYRADEE